VIADVCAYVLFAQFAICDASDDAYCATWSRIAFSGVLTMVGVDDELFVLKPELDEAIRVFPE
jgi:hypothetical protein